MRRYLQSLSSFASLRTSKTCFSCHGVSFQESLSSFGHSWDFAMNISGVKPFTKATISSVTP